MRCSPKSLLSWEDSKFTARSHQHLECTWCYFTCRFDVVAAHVVVAADDDGDDGDDDDDNDDDHDDKDIDVDVIDDEHYDQV